MKQSRLENLSDSIFGIVMTLLVFEIKIPNGILLTSSSGIATPNTELFLYLVHNVVPILLSYLLSFVVLFSYWRSHHFILSGLARNIDSRLTNINALFFFFVGLTPFSAHFLGVYSQYQFPVILFALNIIAIGLVLHHMRGYIINSKSIENTPVTDIENSHAHARLLFPIVCAGVAICVTFINIKAALSFLTFGIIYNLSSSSTRYTFHFIQMLFGRVKLKEE
jgi:uncharacterized membrane protein